MDTIENLYDYFITAFRFCAADKGRGIGKSIAIDTGVSSQFISRILHKNNKIKAPNQLQKKIAESFGYSIRQFLFIGKEIKNGNLDPLNSEMIKAVDGEYLIDPNITERERIIEMYERLLVFHENRILKLEDENKELRSKLLTR